MRLSTPDTYTEQLLYADGAAPRYTGCPTGRINILGGRYDYIFDAHDRLTRADYTPAADAANPDEDFSVVYTYDALARPKSVQRMGIIDLAADGTETFGCLDRLRYLYDDAGRVRTIGNDGDPDEYYGRPGFAAGGSEYEWDDAGRMTSDTGRGLTLIKYDHRNLPLQQRFDTGLMQTNVYDAAGALVRTTMSSTAIRPTVRPTVRNYAANRVWEGGKLRYSYFTGGYFDGSGCVHYLHNDYQGSVVMVTDSAGTVEQRNTYYPYGEPHRTPSGQPILYGGKEHDLVTSDYNYDARRFHAPMLLMSSVDPLAGGTPQLSPYVFCAANPIRYIDLTGRRFTKPSLPYITLFENEINNQISNTSKTIYEQLRTLQLVDANGNQIKATLNSLMESSKKLSELKETLYEVNVLKNSDQAYHIYESEKLCTIDKIVDGTTMNPLTGCVLLIMASFKLSDTEHNFGGLAHELKHAYQFEIGEYGMSTVQDNFDVFTIYDQYDEVIAYKRGAVFGQPQDVKVEEDYNYLEKGPLNVLNIQFLMFDKETFQNIANRLRIAFRYNGKTYNGF